MAYTELEKRALSVMNSCVKGTEQSSVAKALCIGYEAARDIIFEIRKKEAVILGKLTNEQKKVIYHNWKNGRSQADLAREFHVSAASISQVIRKLVQAEEDMGIAEEKPKPGIVNPEFDAAVDDMIAEMHSESASTEEKSADAEPDKLPDYIWSALDDKISMINLDIETREQRIGELQDGISALVTEREQIRAWMEAHHA